VVLVDASTEGDPGAISVRRVRPRPATPATWPHHLNPETLAGLAEALYGAVAPIVLVRVAAGSFADGDALALIALAVTYAGHTWGLGRLWAKLPFVQRNRWLI
jgi:hypothetical protein